MRKEPMSHHIEWIFHALSQGMPWAASRASFGETCITLPNMDTIDPKRFNRGEVIVDGEHYTVSVFHGNPPKSIVIDPIPHLKPPLLKGLPDVHVELVTTKIDQMTQFIWSKMDKPEQGSTLMADDCGLMDKGELRQAIAEALADDPSWI